MLLICYIIYWTLRELHCFFLNRTKNISICQLIDYSFDKTRTAHPVPSSRSPHVPVAEHACFAIRHIGTLFIFSPRWMHIHPSPALAGQPMSILASSLWSSLLDRAAVKSKPTIARRLSTAVLCKRCMLIKKLNVGRQYYNVNGVWKGPNCGAIYDA